MTNSMPPVLEDAPCPVCGTRDDEPVLTGHDWLHGLPGEFTIVRCANCGLMRTNPRPTRATMELYYPDDYLPYQQTVAIDGRPPQERAGLLRKIRTGIRRGLGMESKRLPRETPGHLLEIGCSSGDYLLQMKNRGWRVEGVEFSRAAARRARESGLDVRCSTIEKADPPSEQVDIVAAWMVLEHLHDPVGSLKKIRCWIRPDGFLVASVPDADSWMRRIFGNRCYDVQLPTHLFHYTPRTLELLLRHAGWELVRTRWQRNSNTLLKSLEYLSRDRGYQKTEKAALWIRTATKAAPARMVLNLLLGLAHQSGRIEIWARPLTTGKEG